MRQGPKYGQNVKKNHSPSYGNVLAAIDEYIALQPEEIRPILEKIRKTIKSTAPKATEKMSWGMPTFWQGKNLIHFAVCKNHIGIYPGDLNTLPFKRQLSVYKTTKDRKSVV